MHKHITNTYPPHAHSGGDGAGAAIEQLTIYEEWVDDQDNTAEFKVELFRQGSMVTMFMPRVALGMESVNNWRRAALIPPGWRPQEYTAVTFPSMTNINSTVGRYDYDVDVLCLAEITPNGSAILWREPPPGSATWSRPDATSRVGWLAWSMQWIIPQLD